MANRKLSILPIGERYPYTRPGTGGRFLSLKRKGGTLKGVRREK